MRKMIILLCMVVLMVPLTFYGAGSKEKEAVEEVAAPEVVKGVLEGKNLFFVLFSFDGYQLGQGSWFKTLAEAEGAKVTLVDGRVDPMIQVKGVEDAIAAGADGIMWHVVRGPTAVNAVLEAQAAGVPVVLTGSRPDVTTGAITPFVQLYDYEGAKEAGKIAAEWLKKNKPGEKAKYVYFDRVGVPHCGYRGNGFIDGLKEVLGEENIEKVYRDDTKAGKEDAMALMEDLLVANPDFNMFWGCGSTHALGGLAALKAAGRGKAVNGVPLTEFVMSIDGTPDEVVHLLDPTSALKATLALLPKENAMIYVDLFKRIYKGEIRPNDNIVYFAPGELLPMDCESINEYLGEEYGMVKGYEKLDCSKY